MKIYGLQKMTLLDFPGKVACTVFLGGCDFRCPFCHNFELVDGTAPAAMEEEELMTFLKKRRGLLDGVAVTGGEPCLHKDLPDLLRSFRELGFQTKLDTNGYHPELLSQILKEGLADYVAMDIKNSPGKYALTCGCRTVDLERIRESIRLIMSEAPDYEFRTTVVKEFHAPEDFREIAEMIAGARRYFIQGFTDRDTVPCRELHAPDAETLAKAVETVREKVSCVELRGMD